MDTKTVLVMWDYSAFPLWTSSTRLPEHDPNAVPVSSALRDDLVAWAAAMESAMPGDNRRRKRPTPDELTRLNERGRDLAQRVRDELDETWSVSYHDELTNEEETMPLPPPPSTRRRHHRS